ncbi:MAG: ATP-binding protein [Kiritimatiellae bacterium]|nr:ATP-binding protein [Kiritimatiellia bacterium]
MAMSKQRSAARTMRIDIAPETATRALRGPRKPPAVPTPTFVARRQARTDRNTPYDKLLASVYDAVLITDLRGFVLDFNGRALEFFQIDEARLPGISVIDLISGADESLIATIRSNLSEHKYTVVEARCTRTDGSTFPVEIAVNMVDLDAEGQLCFFVRDTTVRKRAQEELQNAVERLEALDRARLEFVSNVSHELRTPLTSMIYAVKNMQRGVTGPLPEKAMQYLERLNADCRRLLGTVNDILDLRQIENRTLTLTKSRVPLARLVETGVDALRVQADEKRVQLLMCLPPQPCFVLCDPHKLERVILNIVGNALKFTPGGGSIRVAIEPDPRQENQIVIRVRDTGIGIPPEALDRITLRYFKVGDQPAGSGLGLAISRELVELHGGKLQVESPVPGTDRGTQVSVFMPLTEAPLVLVTCDDDALRERMRAVCQAQGCRVQTQSMGRATLDHCRQSPPDVLVIDLALPDLPGAEVVLQLRNDRRLARLPIVAITGETLVRAQIDMFKAFAIPLLAKPLRDHDLAGHLSAVFFDRGLSGGLSAGDHATRAHSATTSQTAAL